MAFRIKTAGKDSEKVSYGKIAGEIRKSQCITTYGPGALVDFPRASTIIDGIDNWESSLGKYNFNKMKIHERNLESILGKDFFIQPQMIDNDKKVHGINATRFPEYCYCPECGVLDRYRKIEKKTANIKDYNHESYCAACYQSKNRNVKLIPSRFVVSCEKGHLDDFPYDWWVHRRTGACGNSKLTIEISKHTNSLEGIVIKCACGAKENLDGIMDKGALYQRRCFGAMPWLGKSEDKKGWYSDLPEKEPCESQVVVLQRGANNVYYSNVISALTIPPYSSRIQRYLIDYINNLEDYYSKSDSLKEANLRDFFEQHCKVLRCDYDSFKRQVDIALNIDNKSFQNPRELVIGEYEALCDDDCKDPDFLTIEAPVPNDLKSFIDQIKIVGRLREVQVLNGFSRVYSSINIAPISRRPLKWLPANELYGEGIFIRLSENKISEWEQKIGSRYNELLNRGKNHPAVKFRLSGGSARYVLLHTLSHLLIRELTLQCGYSASSIKEKIYCSSENESNMCGILIYTASADSDGSLGGLARQGVPEKLLDVFLNMLESASWCSNDPICIDSLGQGYSSLNYAACHACTLLPETSCECGNIFLDRAAIVGTSDNPQIGYFAELLQTD
ncbi:Domain of unknown function (DUF1998) [Butyrivibrio fibrisolvens 16/4]|nr:Domain of unknown function (DUF1998) [Butyrivibrio fibrisolvens 16/4]